MSEKEFIDLQGERTEFKTQWRQEVLYTKRMYLAFGSLLAKQLLKTRISANQVTFIHLVLALISLPFFLNPTYIHILVGMALFQISMVFDCADGTIARTRGSAGNYGKFIELNTDRGVEFLLLIAITYAVFIQTGSAWAWALGILAVGLESLIVTHKFGMRFLYTMPSGELRNKIKKGNRLLSVFTYTSFNRHFLLIFFVIFNQLFWYLVIVSVYYAVFYLGMLAFSHRNIKAMDSGGQNEGMHSVA
jgi:phosphatidylglycerophosphate synthase